MQAFGPLTLTANSITQVSCSPASVLVYIGNDTPYDVLVSFSVSRPSLVTSAAGTGDWTAVVQAFHHATLPTPGNISSPQGSTFAGNVWLLPLDTRNTNLALNGTISSTANAWMVACLPGEQPPDAYAAPRQTDITSQARMVAVPISAPSLATLTAFISVGNRYDSPLVVAAAPFSSTVVCYLYGVSAQQFNASGNWSRWEAGFGEYDNLAAIVATHPLIQFVVTGTTGATTPDFPAFQLFPSAPLALSFVPNARTLTVQFYAKLLSSPGSLASALVLNVQADADNLNSVAVPSIGGGGNKTVLYTTPGKVF